MKKYLIIILSLLVGLMMFSCTPGSINITIEPEGAGTVEQVNNEDGTITLIATANENYRFECWRQEGKDDVFYNNCPFTMDGNMNITAVFSEFVIQETTYDFEPGNIGGWSLGGAEEPHVQTDYNPADSTYALQFGQVEPTPGGESVPISNGQVSYIEMEGITLTQGTDLTFDYKVSSEDGWDGMNVYLNGDMTEDNEISGEIDWTTYSYEIPEDGTYTLKIEYYKDSVYSDGMDCMWVDNISMTSMPPTPKISVAGVNNGDIYSRKVLADEPAELKFNIKNNGGADLHLSPISLSNNKFFIDKQPDSVIAPGENSDLILSVTVGDGESASTNVSFLNSDHENNPFSFDIDVEGIEGGSGWLFMMYMAGDNNLESLLWGDVNECEVGLNEMDPALRDIVHVIVLWDGINAPDNKLYELGPDPNGTPGNEGTTLGPNTVELTDGWFTGELNMADGNTITEFVNYCRNKYPGMNDVLILSDHGAGVKSPDGRMRAGWGDEGDTLYTNETAQALIDAGCESMPLKIIGQDACLMGMVEEAHEYRTVAEFHVASPENEQGDGWEFDDWMPDMTLTSLPRDVAQIIVESYRDDIGGSSQTLTATDLSKCDALKTAIDNMAAELYIHGTSSLLPSYGAYLGDFTKDIANNTSLDQDLRDAAEDVLTALGEEVVYGWAGSSIHGGYDGEGPVIQDGLKIETSSASWYTDQPYSDHGLIDFCSTSNDGIVNTWVELLEEWD
jgi:hypothetical protein